MYILSVGVCVCTHVGVPGFLVPPSLLMNSHTHMTVVLLWALTELLLNKRVNGPENQI